MNKTPIIESIEEQEIYDYTLEISNKKRIIIMIILVSLVFLITISIYIFPTFLSKKHQQSMRYHANFSTPQNSSTPEDIQQSPNKNKH